MSFLLQNILANPLKICYFYQKATKKSNLEFLENFPSTTSPIRGLFRREITCPHQWQSKQQQKRRQPPAQLLKSQTQEYHFLSICFSFFSFSFPFPLFVGLFITSPLFPKLLFIYFLLSGCPPLLSLCHPTPFRFSTVLLNCNIFPAILCGFLRTIFLPSSNNHSIMEWTVRMWFGGELKKMANLA